MDMKLYNSLTRQKEGFEPINPDLVRVYSCGPTVYNTASIGNFRAFLFADLLVRTLRFNGHKVRWVMNITDVGHLTDDASDGEDKMEKASRETGKTAWDIAQMYTDEFLLDMDKFGIHRPDAMPRATDHIEEQIEIVKKLEENGFTYTIADGVYFDTSKLENYGQLSGQSVEDKEEGARVEVNSEKRNASDFALWKLSQPEESRQMEWESPWGVGFPGWHVECTAMSTKELGALYDIHTGGEDHKMVHHPNEMAQSQGALGTDEAKVWMHNAFLQVDGGKMSKSLKNTYTASDLEQKDVEPMAFRYLVLTADYRQPLNFTWDSVHAAQTALRKLRATVREWNSPTAVIKRYEELFVQAVNDDLDTPRAIALMWELVHDAEQPTGARAATILKFDQVFGLRLDAYVARPVEAPDEVRKLMDDRRTARAAKDWGLSDQIRDQIKELGYVVEDTPDGQRLSEI